MGKGKKKYQTSKLFKKLKDKLFFPCLGLFPKDELAKLTGLEVLDKLNIGIDLFDNPILIKNQSEVYVISSEIDLTVLYQKSEQLEENLFNLQHYQTVLVKEEFTNLLQKYVELSYGYLYLSIQINVTLNQNPQESVKEHINLYLWQEECYRRHFEALQIQFSIRQVNEKEGINILKVKEEEKEEQTKENIVKEDWGVLSNQAKEDKLNLSNLRVRKYLLKTVFHLPLEDE